MSKIYRILLLFNANKIYDRQIIEGVGNFIAASQVEWEVYVEDDYLIDRSSIESWQGDGIIADLDDPEIVRALENTKVPVIGVGSSYENVDDYPRFPYVWSAQRTMDIF